MANLKKMKEEVFPQSKKIQLFSFILTHPHIYNKLVKLSCLPHAGHGDWDVMLSMYE